MDCCKTNATICWETFLNIWYLGELNWDIKKNYYRYFERNPLTTLAYSKRTEYPTDDRDKAFGSKTDGEALSIS